MRNAGVRTATLQYADELSGRGGCLAGYTAYRRVARAAGDGGRHAGHHAVLPAHGRAAGNHRRHGADAVGTLLADQPGIEAHGEPGARHARGGRARSRGAGPDLCGGG